MILQNLVSDMMLVDDVCKGIVAKHRGYCPNKPHQKQREFLAIDAIEAGYGGAAGGGKSDALLMGALEHVHVPGYAALLLRRTFRDLNQPDAIMARAHEWLKGTDAKWNANAYRYTFPSGATITFGYLDCEKDKDQYASAAYQYIGFDEATQFPEKWYLFLFSRLRRKAKMANVPLRMRAATNPGGIGHVWFKRRFVDRETATAPFVPALLVDNPHIDADGYRESLSRLDKLTRDQLENGVWRNDVAGLVYQFSALRNIIRAAPPCTRHVLGLDYGATRDACSFNVLGWRSGDPKIYVLKSYKRQKVSPSEAAIEAEKLGRDMKVNFDRVIGDANGLGSGYVLEARKRFQIPVEAADKNNKAGYIKLYNGELEEGRVLIVEPECRQLIEEYSELPWEDEGRTKEAEAFPNHCADGVLYGWRACSAYLRQIHLSGAIPTQFTNR